MAAPLAHIILALNFLSLVPDLFDEKEFIVGTSFPDIRFLGIISREETHAENVSLGQVLAERNSFKAGMKFHAFVDEALTAFAIEHDIFGTRQEHFDIFAAFKFNFDIFLCSVECDLAKILHHFDHILDEETQLNVPTDFISCWHNALQKYLKDPISHKNRLKFFQRCSKKRHGIYTKSCDATIKKIAIFKIDELFYEKIAYLIDQNLNNPCCQALIADFYRYFNFKLADLYNYWRQNHISHRCVKTIFSTYLV